MPLVLPTMAPAAADWPNHMESMVSDRQRHEATIGSLFGCPGTSWETDAGNEIILHVLRRLGVAAFTDEALKEIAQANKNRDSFFPETRGTA